MQPQRRAREVVVLVDGTGVVLGSAGKLDAHRPPGQLHLAFSVLLYRDDGALLIQQRAAGKYHFPGVWANACCSHPAPGEDLGTAATARVAEELGIAVSLEEVGSFEYRATCPSTGLVEHELDHVFLGAVTASPRPDPSEVAATQFVEPDALRSGAFSGELAPWLLRALDLAESTRSGRSPRVGSPRVGSPRVGQSER